jgi:hypothetical protein
MHSEGPDPPPGRDGPELCRLRRRFESASAPWQIARPERTLPVIRADSAHIEA